MRGKAWYIRITLTSLVAILLVSTVFGVYGPENQEETESLVTGEIPEIDRNQPENYSTATFATRCFWGPDARLGVAEGVIRTRIGFLEVKNSTLDDSGLKREAVRVDYDPEKVSHQELYDMVEETGQLKEFPPLAEFVPADRTQQSYELGQHEELSNGFQNIYPEFGDFINSTAASRINGYLTGYGDLDSPEDLEGLGLTERGKQEVYDIWGSREIACDVP